MRVIPVRNPSTNDTRNKPQSMPISQYHLALFMPFYPSFLLPFYETIIPADSITATRYIRDKTLRKNWALAAIKPA